MKNQLFKESRTIYKFQLSNPSMKESSEPGGLEDRLFLGPSPVVEQAEAAGRTPSGLIKGIINDTRELLSNTLRLPFQKLQDLGKYTTDVVEKLGNVGNRVLQAVTTPITAATTIPAVITSKVSTAISQAPGFFTTKILWPIKALLNRIPFTNGGKNSPPH